MSEHTVYQWIRALKASESDDKNRRLGSFTTRRETLDLYLCVYQYICIISTAPMDGKGRERLELSIRWDDSVLCMT